VKDLVLWYLLATVIVIPDIPLDAYRACLFNTKAKYETIYTAFSLFYGTFFHMSAVLLPCVLTQSLDVVAFLVIIRSPVRNVGRLSSLVRTIIRDATVYFLVIFTSHTILTFFVLFARVSIDLYKGLFPCRLLVSWDAGEY